MPTAKFICGAECGIAAVGTASAGVEHWSTVTGTPTVVTSGPSPMRSTRCFRFNPSAATIDLRHTFAAAVGSPATGVARFYIYFASLPAADVPLFRFTTATTPILGVVYESSDNTIRAGNLTAANDGGSGVVVTTGQWYRIDVKVVYDTTRTCDVRVNGTAVNGVIVAGTAGTITNFFVGALSSATADFYVDDIIASGTSADWPIGEGTCVGLYPTGDRTNVDVFGGGAQDLTRHIYSSVSGFGKGASGATNLSAQNVESTSWQSLQTVLSTTIGSNWVSGRAQATSDQLCYDIADLPGSAGTVNGFQLVATSHSASATGNNFSLGLTLASSSTFVDSILADLSETTITVPILCRSTINAAQATVADINDLFASFASSDVNPDVYLDGFCLEVDYVPVMAHVNRRGWQSG